MEFKITHENRNWSYAMVVGMIIVMLFCMTAIPQLMTIASCAGFALLAVCLIMNLLYATVRTKIIVEGDEVRIKYPITYRCFAIDDICCMNYEHYEVRRKRSKYSYYLEQRCRLTFTINSNGREYIVKLNDSATEAVNRGFLQGYDYVRKPDEDVALYNACRYIESIRGNYYFDTNIQ